jgi:hypothetical protein
MKRLFIALIFVCNIFFLSACGSNNSNNDADETYAPDEAAQPSAYIRYSTPPDGFPYAMGWMHAIDIEGNGGSSKVEVDWMRLYATINGSDVLLLDETFDTETSSMSNYGLYLRNPWYGEDDYNEKMPFTVENSTLVIYPNQNPNRVYHWWVDRVNVSSTDITKVWFEARVRVAGGAGVQAAIDYWIDDHSGWAKNNKNNIEACASDWFGNSTSEWQIISAEK